MKIRINMLSKATSVPGQGVGSAYQEQIKLVNSLDDIDMAINSKDSNFDIYHIHSPNPSLKMKMNKKHINVMHVHFVPQHNEGSLRLIWPCNVIFKQYAKSLYRKADELVVVNPTFTKYIEELGISRDRVTYIPNYVDPEAFHPLAKAEIEQLKDQYGIPHDKFIVLGCGQIQVRKGFDDFVEVAKKSPDKFFLWVGGFSFGFLIHIAG